MNATFLAKTARYSFDISARFRAILNGEVGIMARVPNGNFYAVEFKYDGSGLSYYGVRAVTNNSDTINMLLPWKLTDTNDFSNVDYDLRLVYDSAVRTFHAYAKTGQQDGVEPGSIRGTMTADHRRLRIRVCGTRCIRQSSLIVYRDAALDQVASAGANRPLQVEARLKTRESMKRELIAGIAVAAVAAGAVELHVNPSAAPDGDGSAAWPFATLVGARDGLRAARKAGAVAKDARVDIVLAPGDYVLAAGLVLDVQDGGASADAPVTWKAARPGTARIVGACRVPVAACRPVTDPAVLARLPEEAHGKVYEADVAALLPAELPPMADRFGATPTAPLLFINHKIATLARWPNDDFTSFSKSVDRGAVLKRHAGNSAEYGPGAFIYENPRAKRWNFAQGVWMNGYWTHDWDNYSVRAAAYGVENGTNDVVRLATGVPYGVMGGTWGRKGRRFYVFNLLDELDVPNEWHLDRVAKKLYFYPPNGTLAATDEVFLASLNEPLVEDGGEHQPPALAGALFEYTYNTGLQSGRSGHSGARLPCDVLRRVRVCRCMATAT